MQCHNRHKDGRCEIVTHLIGEPYKVNEAACRDCIEQASPMGQNRVTGGIALAAVRNRGEEPSSQITRLASSRPPANGPGTELESLIPGFFKSKKCSCRSYARRMNEWGVTGCTNRFDDIVDHLVHQAGKHKLLSIFGDRPARAVASSLVRKAIDQAKAVTIGDLTERGNDALVSTWPFVWTYFANGAVGDELKYSIRSVLHWHPDAKVYIVGDRPEWYTGEMFEKPRLSKRPHQAFKDCYSRILHAAERLPQFVWMMDDLYWINPFDMSDAITPKYVRHVWPDRYKKWKPQNAWGRTRQTAYAWLFEHNRPTYDFASHLPQPIVSESLQGMERQLRLLEEYRNWECIYFNSFHSASGVDWGRKTCRVVNNTKKIDTSKPILNHIHSRYHGMVSDFLQTKFPHKSSVEA